MNQDFKFCSIAEMNNLTGNAKKNQRDQQQHWRKKRLKKKKRNQEQATSSGTCMVLKQMAPTLRAPMSNEKIPSAYYLQRTRQYLFSKVPYFNNHYYFQQLCVPNSTYKNTYMNMSSTWPSWILSAVSGSAFPYGDWWKPPKRPCLYLLISQKTETATYTTSSLLDLQH